MLYEPAGFYSGNVGSAAEARVYTQLQRAHDMTRAGLRRRRRVLGKYTARVQADAGAAPPCLSPRAYTPRLATDIHLIRVFCHRV